MTDNERMDIYIENVTHAAREILNTGNFDRVRFHAYQSLEFIAQALANINQRLTTLENRERGEK